ncbi:unnamed protein product [Mytilus coruscus]|uniref:Reverse transcriptase domain-containing protein n=1 Tax=Mytilus coruscus TaxID=42192 RepID=A0A6J8BVJ4_MYTCO|nr:unnamed protein product [Mytilus coruscus]
MAGRYQYPFNIKQGVRQGGILSTHLYKVFVQDLLVELEENALGYHLGNVYVGTPTCADDIAFISNVENKLQIMLNVLSRYANEHHYTIHPMKTQIIDCSKTKSNYKWNLGGNEINTAESGVHLGIIRAEKNECQINIQERIQIPRRTKYALMGSEVHGTNGLDPSTSYNIYKTYFVPRLIYGLEVLPMTKANIEQLEKFHRKNLRHIQSLPERTSNAAVLLLIGALPIEAEIHKRCLSLLLSLLNCGNDKIHQILTRQITTNFDNNKSFFTRIMDILEMYGLPSITQLQKNTPKKEHWKNSIKIKVDKFWYEKTLADVENKSSLTFLNTSNLEPNKPHHVWNVKQLPRFELRKAIIKARVMTGTYILQADKYKFTHYNVEATCQLCCSGNEEVIHFLTTCPILSTTREKYFSEIREIITYEITAEMWNNVFKNKTAISQLIVDCTKYKEVLNISNKLLNIIENKTRNLIFQLHMDRLKILEKNNE